MEAHHLRHWADGGETRLDNLLNLCKFHHTQLHRGCFDIRVQAPATLQAEPRVIFSTPSGRHIETTTFPQFPVQAVDTAKAALQRIAPRVDATTCKTKWAGEPVDYGLAIDALMRRDWNLL